jgi:hypothetical protein
MFAAAGAALGLRLMLKLAFGAIATVLRFDLFNFKPTTNKAQP